MEKEYSDYQYSKRDLEKAYTSGMEYSIAILEKTIGLSINGQRKILESLKKMIAERKVEAVMNSR